MFRLATIIHPNRRSFLKLGISAGMMAGLASRTFSQAGRGWVIYSFLQGVPEPFVFQRGGTPRFAFGANYRWARFDGDRPRVHHDKFGAVLGTLLESAFVEKLPTFAYVGPDRLIPEPFSGGNMPEESDSFGLASVGLQDVIGRILHLSASSDEKTIVQFQGTTGSTEVHSLQVLIRQFGPGGGTTFGLSGSENIATLDSSGRWELVAAEQQIPSKASRQARLSSGKHRRQEVAFVSMAQTRYAPTIVLLDSPESASDIRSEWAGCKLSEIESWDATDVTLTLEWYHQWPFSRDDEPVLSLYDLKNPNGDHIKISGMADGSLRITCAYNDQRVVFDSPAPERYSVCRASFGLYDGRLTVAVNGLLRGSLEVGAIGNRLTDLTINSFAGQHSNIILRSLEVGPASQISPTTLSAPLAWSLV